MSYPGSRPRPKVAASSEESTTSLRRSVDAYLESQGISSVSVVADVMDCWPRIVGEQVAAHAFPSKIVNGELTVLVDHPAWATELRLSAARIVSQLQIELNMSLVERLEVHVRS